MTARAPDPSKSRDPISDSTRPLWHTWLIGLCVIGLLVTMGAGWWAWSERYRTSSLQTIIATYDQQNFSRAYRQAGEHLSRWSSDRQAQLLAAKSLSRLGYVDRAEDLYAAIPDLSLEDRHVRGDGLVNARRHEQAATVYRDLLERWPNNVLALRRLAALEVALDQVQVAVKLADRLIAIPEGRVIGYTLKGTLYFNGGETFASAEALGKVLELDPNLDEMPLEPQQMFWGYLSQNLITLGRSAEARQHLERALNEHPRDAGLMDLMARTYELEGRIEEARRCWQEASRWDPNQPSPWLNLGQLALADRDYSEAISLLERASRCAPNAPEPYYVLSQAYRRLGDSEQADSYRRKADALQTPQ